MKQEQKLKVVVIGGGSSYTPELVEGLLKRHHELPITDLWLVDIEDEDKWSDFIVHLFEAAEAPILLGEGNAPSVNSLQFQRWERKIYSKLKDIVGKPCPDEDLSILQAESNPTPEPDLEPEVDDFEAGMAEMDGQDWEDFSALTRRLRTELKPT